jgi:hypothetical protein
MLWTRLRNHRTASRIGAVDDLRFPAGGRHRLGGRHPHLSDDEIRLAEAAARQWFRLLVRYPRAKLSMPSVVVDELWQELTLHTADYAAFCDAAFGRLQQHRPGSATNAETADTNRAAALSATLNYARRDENRGPTGLPLLFRVDQQLRIRDGNRYLADCGGRGECFGVSGMICLQHLGGVGRRIGPRGNRGDLAFHHGRYGYGGGAHAGGDAGGDVGGGDGGGGGE